MNTRLTYLPAYVGLFASLWLALICNSFLDIQYGGFAFEVCFWAIIHAWTLHAAWLQQGETSDAGRQKQKIVLLIGAVLFLVIFLPMWGLPRAGLYLLSMLQAAQNCVTTTRRQLHFGLMVSAVMVMFAASHYRADWSMLFYLLPYIVAVVSTLVAEQISRRAEAVREQSLKDTGRAGQGFAIAAATSLILGLTAMLYMAIPQLTWPMLYSKWGQESNLGKTGQSEGGEQGKPGDSQSDESAAGADPSESSSGDNSGNQSKQHSWPTPGEMRAMAERPGMPAWQAGTIRQLADFSESLGQYLTPITQELANQIEKLKEWLQKNRSSIIFSLGVLATLMLIVALLLLLREAKARTWIRTRVDYWYLVTLARSASGRAGVLQYYRAMERLFMLSDTPRLATSNTREFLREATYFKEALRPDATQLTLMFERYRYGQGDPTPAELDHVKELYRRIYQHQAS